MTTETTTQGRIIAPTGATAFVAIRYLYDPADPTSVVIRFLLEGSPPINWRFDRAHLAQAVAEEYAHVQGEDYSLARIGEVLHLHLVGDREADVVTKAVHLADFLTLCDAADVDAFLGAIA